MDETPSRRRSLDALALVALSIPLAVERALLIGRDTRTAADETLYLMQALDWLGRFTKLSPDVHRTWGVPAIIAPIAAATDEVSVYRVAFAFLSVAFCAVAYLVGRQFLDVIPAAFAALLLGLAPTTLLGSVALLPDVSAALGVAVAYSFYWRRVVRAPTDETPRSLWPVGVAVASVLYFNIAFAAFAAAAIGLDYVIFRRRQLVSRATFGLFAGVAGGIAPYFLTILVRYGDPTYTLRIGLRGVGATSPAGDPGYVVYARWFFEPDRFFGPFWGALVIAGIVTLAYAAFRGSPIPRRDAAALAIWLVVPTLFTAFLFHAEARYMLPWFPPFFLALALPAQAALGFRPGAKAVPAALTAVLIAGAVAFGVSGYRPAAHRIDRQAVDFNFVHAMAERLGDEQASPPCLVFTRWPREFELNTGCKTLRYNNRREADLLREADRSAESAYFVWWTGLVGDEAYQPSYLNGFFDRYTVALFSVESRSSLGTIFVYRYVPRD